MIFSSYLDSVDRIKTVNCNKRTCTNIDIDMLPKAVKMHMSVAYDDGCNARVKLASIPALVFTHLGRHELIMHNLKTSVDKCMHTNKFQKHDDICTSLKTSFYSELQWRIAIFAIILTYSAHNPTLIATFNHATVGVIVYVSYHWHISAWTAMLAPTYSRDVKTDHQWSV